MFTAFAALLLLCGCVNTHAFGGGETVAFTYRYPQALQCPQLTLDALGANPGTDITDALAQLDSPYTGPGVLFVSRGTYTVSASLHLRKPVAFQAGGVLRVLRGATLSFQEPLTAGDHPIFEGEGRVAMSRQQPALLVDWFGARGTGLGDDARAINWALQVANDSNLEAVFGAKRYAVGTTLKKGQGMRVFSLPGAELVATKKGLVGMEYEAQGHLRPDRLPTFTGFHTAVKFSDVGQTDAYIPLIQPVAGKPCKAGIWFNGDSTQVKFGTIRNCETGVLVTTPDAGRYVMQGFYIEGERYVDTVGVGKQVVLMQAVNTKRPPYWDHSGVAIGTVTPSPKAKGFAVVRSNYPDKKLAFQHYKVGRLDELPASGRIVDAGMWDSELRVGLPLGFKGFKEGQLAYREFDWNTIIFEGPGAKTAKVHVLAAATNSRAAFLQQNRLVVTPWQNRVKLQVPARSWKAGETRQYYLYHQLAVGGDQLFFNIPGVGSKCIGGKLAVTASPTTACPTTRSPWGARTRLCWMWWPARPSRGPSASIWPWGPSVHDGATCVCGSVGAHTNSAIS